jgi:uncharacterized protein
MRILIDIGHPAHVHLFKNFAWEMQKKGHYIFFTCREKEFEIDLLTSYGFNFKSFGKKYNSSGDKLWGLVEFDLKELLTSLKFKPDLFLSHGSMYAAQCSFLLRKPHISLEDTFNFEQIKLYKPFTSAILTADYQHPVLGKSEIKYSGYHELAYLHPKIYTPEKSVLTDLAVDPGEKYVILRFVSWSATHDKGHIGISSDNKLKVSNEFSKYARVFISSEKPLPSELEKYKIPIAPEKMHDAIAFSSLVFGESATMVSEAAVLGIPGIYLDNAGRYYTKEQEEKYGLVFNFSESLPDQEKAIERGLELLNTPEIENRWQEKRQKMLGDKVNTTAFLIWFVECWPESFKIMKENPEYQERFK